MQNKAIYILNMSDFERQFCNKTICVLSFILLLRKVYSVSYCELRVTQAHEEHKSKEDQSFSLKISSGMTKTQKFSSNKNPFTKAPIFAIF